MSAEIVRLTDPQIPAAAATLAHAFHDDPLMAYTIPDPVERARLLPGVYARMIRFGVLAGEVYATAPAIDGVALWLPPNAKWTRENIEASGMHETPALIGDDAYQRYREVVGREWRARERDMTASCWYLFLLGVEPNRQRRGLGGALMSPGIERSDAEQVPCYLETENERNVAFYLKHGFDLIVNGEEAGDSGVRFWTFSRTPKGKNTMPNERSLGTVEVKTFSTKDFRLQSGEVIPELKLVFETYGTLAPDGRNAILATHGYTSSQHAAGLNGDGEPGWWDGLIGPGKALDTDKYFVVSSNMLGSSYGSTAPASINPNTGKPYGPDFPDYSVVDIVTAQRAMLDALGVKRLVAVAGLSYGGYQAFQWSVTFPDAMRGIVATVTSPKATNGDQMVADLRARFAEAPGWNAGHHYGNAEMLGFMTEMRVATLKRYGIEAQLAASVPDPIKREAMIYKLAEPWAKVFDPNSLIALARARSHYNAEKDFAKIRAKLLYVLSRTDKLFPPSIAPDVMAKLKAADVDAAYFEIDSDKGHMASGADWQKWDRVLRDFLKRLE